MIRNSINKIILPFYDDVNKQNFRKVKSNVMPCPIFRSAPIFQLMIDASEELDAITFINIADNSESEIYHSSFCKKYSVNYSTLIVSLDIEIGLLDGIYYMSINNKYFSEVFEINKTDELFKISFSDDNDLDGRVYQNIFKETFYTKASIKAIKPYSETKSIKRSGEEYFTEQVFFDQFQLSFSSYLNVALAIQRINLFSSVKIETPAGDTFDVTNCDSTADEIFETGIFKSEITFRTNKIYKNSHPELLNIAEIFKLSPNFIETDQEYNYDNNYYSMFSRVVVNPINHNIVNTFKIGYSHTSVMKYFFLRISRNSGETWEGVGIERLAYSRIDVSEWINNPTPFYTKTGRLIIFFQWSATSSSPRSKSCYIYSDDDGKSWSEMLYFTDPSIPNIYKNSYFFAAEAVYSAEGLLLMPYNMYVNGTLEKTVSYIASSDDNGETWDNDYSVLFDNSAETLNMSPSEHEWTDCGNGIVVMISRTLATNSAGHNMPVMFCSLDSGKNWNGTEETLNRAAIDNKENLSGYAYLEGPGVNMGDLEYIYNNALPSINCLTVNGEKWLLILYWIRKNETFKTIQRANVIKLDDYLSNGVNAIKNIAITIFDGSDATSLYTNGGNGNGAVFGEDVIFTTYHQTTSASTGGRTSVHTMNISKSIIEGLIDSYNNA